MAPSSPGKTKIRKNSDPVYAPLSSVRKEKRENKSTLTSHTPVSSLNKSPSMKLSNAKSNDKSAYMSSPDVLNWND